MNYKDSGRMKALFFVLRRDLCWFSLNYVRKQRRELFEIIRNENARKLYRLHVTLVLVFRKTGKLKQFKSWQSCSIRRCSLPYFGVFPELRTFIISNKTPAKAFTPPAKTKMITRPGRAVTRTFIGGGVCSFISVLPNEFLFKSVIIRVPSNAF